MRILLVLLLISSCGRKEEPVVDNDKELQVFVDEFYADVQELGLTTSNVPSVTFKELGEKTMGHAFIESRRIEINTLHWGELNDRSKRVLIYHEMIHAACIMHGHSEDENDIMYPYHRTNYINRLSDEEFTAYLVNGVKKWCSGLDWYPKPLPIQNYITDL